MQDNLSKLVTRQKRAGCGHRGWDCPLGGLSKPTRLASPLIQIWFCRNVIFEQICFQLIKPAANSGVSVACNRGVGAGSTSGGGHATPCPLTSKWRWTNVSWAKSHGWWLSVTLDTVYPLAELILKRTSTNLGVTGDEINWMNKSWESKHLIRWSVFERIRAPRSWRKVIKINYRTLWLQFSPLHKYDFL